MWFRRRTLDNFYTPKERKIYRYFNGEKVVHADPMILYKKIMAVGQELAVDIDVAKSPCKEAIQADDEAVRKLREIFEVKPVTSDGKGLGEAEVIELFDHFWEFLEGLKKNSSPSSTTSTSASSPPADSVTPSTSASGSSANGSSSSKPEPSLSGSAS